MNQLYILRAGQQYGPYSPQEVRTHLASGQLLDTDLAWFDGAPEWMPLTSVPGLSLPRCAPPPPPRRAVPPPPPLRMPSGGVTSQPFASGNKAKSSPVATGCAVIAGCFGLLGIIAAIGMLMESSPKASDFADAKKYDWAVVGNFGMVRSIYINPAALKDTEFMSGLVSHLVPRGTVAQLMFFDDRAYCSEWPMSDKGMLHWKATYNFNPNTRHERFVFIEITNPRTSPPDTREIPAPIKRR